MDVHMENQKRKTGGGKSNGGCMSGHRGDMTSVDFECAAWTCNFLRVYISATFENIARNNRKVSTWRGMFHP